MNDSAPRIGIVVVGHGPLAPAMVNAVLGIEPDTTGLIGVAIDSTAPVDVSRQLVRDAIEAVNQHAGILLLTDLFGGTPSNLCLAFLEPGTVEIISGVNLPMLIKLVSGLQEQPLADITNFIQHYGQKNIVIASHVLDGRLG